MKITKTKDGITLIALVITIIILIILAGVSLNLILGNNGIITKAKLGKQEMANEQALENIALAQYDNEIETHISASNRDVSSGVVKRTLFKGNLSTAGKENSFELADSWKNYDLFIFRSVSKHTSCLLDNFISRETMAECYEGEYKAIKINSDNDDTYFNIGIVGEKALFLEGIVNRELLEIIGIKF